MSSSNCWYRIFQGKIGGQFGRRWCPAMRSRRSCSISWRIRATSSSVYLTTFLSTGFAAAPPPLPPPPPPAMERSFLACAASVAVTVPRGASFAVRDLGFSWLGARTRGPRGCATSPGYNVVSPSAAPHKQPTQQPTRQRIAAKAAPRTSCSDAEVGALLLARADQKKLCRASLCLCSLAMWK